MQLFEWVCGLRQQTALLLHRRLQQGRLPGMADRIPHTTTPHQPPHAPPPPEPPAGCQAVPAELLPQGVISVAQLAAAARDAGVPGEAVEALGYTHSQGSTHTHEPGTHTHDPSAQTAETTQPHTAMGPSNAPIVGASHEEQHAVMQAADGCVAGGGGLVSDQAWVRVMSEDTLAAALSLAMDWPSR